MNRIEAAISVVLIIGEKPRKQGIREKAKKGTPGKNNKEFFCFRMSFQ